MNLRQRTAIKDLTGALVTQHPDGPIVWQEDDGKQWIIDLKGGRWPHDPRPGEGPVKPMLGLRQDPVIPTEDGGRLERIGRMPSDKAPLDRCRVALADLIVCVEAIDDNNQRAIALAGMLEKARAFAVTDQKISEDAKLPSGWEKGLADVALATEIFLRLVFGWRTSRTKNGCQALSHIVDAINQATREARVYLIRAQIADEPGREPARGFPATVDPSARLTDRNIGRPTVESASLRCPKCNADLTGVYLTGLLFEPISEGIQTCPQCAHEWEVCG